MVNGLCNTVAHTLQVFQVRNVKNSAFFFIKSIVYLKSYINFEEIIK